MIANICNACGRITQNTTVSIEAISGRYVIKQNIVSQSGRVHSKDIDLCKICESRVKEMFLSIFTHDLKSINKD